MAPARFDSGGLLRRKTWPIALQKVRMSDTSNYQPRSVPTWRCMPHCGACCKLDDFDRDVLHDMLKSETDVVEYLGMIGSDGWCKWFDSFSRKCTIYENRPRFCRATPDVFNQLYDVPVGQFDEFAISCCEFHIANSYGAESNEAFRFDDYTYSNCDYTPPDTGDSK